MPGLSQGMRGLKPEHLSSLWIPGRTHPTAIYKPVTWGSSFSVTIRPKNASPQLRKDVQRFYLPTRWVFSQMGPPRVNDCYGLFATPSVFRSLRFFQPLQSQASARRSVLLGWAEEYSQDG